MLPWFNMFFMKTLQNFRLFIINIIVIMFYRKVTSVLSVDMKYINALGHYNIKEKFTYLYDLVRPLKGK